MTRELGWRWLRLSALLVVGLGLVLVGTSPVRAITIDFDAGDGDTPAPIGEDFAPLGVHFGASWVYYNDLGLNGTGGDYPASSPPNSAYGPASAATTITFDQAITFFSFWYNDALENAIFNAWAEPIPGIGSCVLCDEVLVINVPNGPDFVSYTPSSAIRSIQFFAGDLTIDDLELRAIPVPATWLLLVFAFAGLGVRAWRRYARR